MSVTHQNRDPYLPELTEIDGQLAPKAPTQLESLDVDRNLLLDLALKLISTVPQLTTEAACRELALAPQIADDLLWELNESHLIDIVGQTGPFNYRYAVTQRGRSRAEQLREMNGYIGPAPVAVESYAAMVRWQTERQSSLHLSQIRETLSELVLPDEAIYTAALAASSGRSLFIFGPPGNGKTSLGKLLHQVGGGGIWIPYCLTTAGSIIRLFDPAIHRPLTRMGDDAQGADPRWVHIERPFVVAGGEMSEAELDLTWIPSLRFYEVPPHLKAMGGTFLIDDFGRQRVAPHELLNRWITPLEHRTDFLTLNSGQKIQLPFRMLLIVATNLSVDEVADPAFLRRMGYRLHLHAPTEETYAEVFRRYAARVDVETTPEMIQQVLDRYQQEGREFRCAEPRELIERCRDICRLQGEPFHLSEDLVDLAWKGFFGNS